MITGQWKVWQNSSCRGLASWEDLIRSWAIANMLNQASGLYGYKGAFSLTPHGPTSANVTMHSGGVVYRTLNGSWTRPADAGAGIMYCGFNSSGEVTCESSSGFYNDDSRK